MLAYLLSSPETLARWQTDNSLLFINAKQSRVISTWFYKYLTMSNNC